MGIFRFLNKNSSPIKELCEAADSGNVTRVKEILETNPSIVNAKDRAGITPLLYATERGYKDLTELLLARGADVEVKGPEGVTPLMTAASFGHMDIVALLLARGANVKAKGPQGVTPLLAASYEVGSKDIVELLLVNGADPNERDGGPDVGHIHRLAQMRRE
jgi:ankyrin repeat protein